ncbi:MAG TPA: carbamoyl-phosphate synthase large subunit, partial [Xanthobacteraceae bacterium]|nr:carbamoyl-phosphate synthase large subunit [Xanthobacteraceae bacterium]
TAYMYSTYETPFNGDAVDEAAPSDKKKVVILGGGPNRIGQGIEFDYCCCHACFALKDAGYETIMINCNPETVSTDYDTSDRLYFEPLTAEDVIEIIDTERRNGTLHGVIVQFGGQTPLKLAESLEKAKVPILGTSPDAIDLAEDRDRFKQLLDRLKLRQPKSGIATSPDQAKAIAEAIGYPIVIRPSYVLGGRAMEIVHDSHHLARYVARLAADLDRPSEFAVSEKRPLLIDRYLTDAVEVDVDCLADGKDSYIAGIMEHIEEAGIHSGDSACSLPPHDLSAKTIAELDRQTRALALALKVGGLMNVQYAIKDGDIYVLEVNPRASRTVPFVAKVTGVPAAKIAARIMAGETLASFKLKTLHFEPGRAEHVGVKEAVFPFARFGDKVDTVLGPEMKSTGEVMGLDRDYNIAFAKSQLGGGTRVPKSGTVFVSVRDADKPRILEATRLLAGLGFRILATSGTQRYLAAQGVEAVKINKVAEGRPHIVDAIKNGDVQLVFNTTEGATALADSRSLRRAALLHKVPYYTTLSGAVAAAQGIRAYLGGDLEVCALQSYFGAGSDRASGRPQRRSV